MAFGNKAIFTVLPVQEYGVSGPLSGVFCSLVFQCCQVLTGDIFHLLVRFIPGYITSRKLSCLLTICILASNFYLFMCIFWWECIYRSWNWKGAHES